MHNQNYQISKWKANRADSDEKLLKKKTASFANKSDKQRSKEAKKQKKKKF